MRITRWAAIALAGCAALFAQPPEKLDFRAHLEKLSSAWTSFDYDAVAKYYAPESNRVFYDVTPLKYAGLAQYIGGFKKTAAQFASMKVTLNSDTQVNQPAPSFAWVTTTMHGVFTLRGGAKTEGDYRWTVILEKRGDSWLIVHEHVSAPVSGP